MSNLNDPRELEREAEEITLPEGRDGGVDAERMESALREGAGFLRIADPLSVERARQETEEGPGTSLG